MLFYFKV